VKFHDWNRSSIILCAHGLCNQKHRVCAGTHSYFANRIAHNAAGVNRQPTVSKPAGRIPPASRVHSEAHFPKLRNRGKGKSKSYGASDFSKISDAGDPGSDSARIAGFYERPCSCFIQLQPHCPTGNNNINNKRKRTFVSNLVVWLTLFPIDNIRIAAPSSAATAFRQGKARVISRSGSARNPAPTVKLHSKNPSMKFPGIRITPVPLNSAEVAGNHRDTAAFLLRVPVEFAKVRHEGPCSIHYVDNFCHAVLARKARNR
jgi:hypothetical protein